MTIVSLGVGMATGEVVARAVDDYFGSAPVAIPMTQSFQRFSSDPVGACTVTLTNLVVGSRYRIERQIDGSLATPTGVAEGVAAGSTVVVQLDYFAIGSPNNDLRIKVRKGTSAPKYLPFETLTTIGASPQFIYVGQVADAIA